MRGSDTAGYSLCSRSDSASLEDASAPVRTNAKNALKPRRRAVGPSTHITPVLSPNSQTYKSSLSISYRAPSPSPSSHDRSSSPSPPARRTSRTPIQSPSTLRSPRLANISTSATLPQRHRRTKSLVTPQPSVSPLSLSPSTPLSKLALPPSPLSPPLSTFRFPASPQTPSSLRRFNTTPISPTSSTRSTSKHHHRLLAPDTTLFISPPRSKPTLAMSIQVHAPILTTPTHSPRVRPSHPSHSHPHSSHPSTSTSTSHYPQSQAQSSPRHSPRPSLPQNPTQGPSHSHTNSPRVRASSPPPLMLDTPQIPRPSSRCERLLRDTLRKADEHERAVLFAASTSASYAYSPNGRRGAYSPTRPGGRRAALKRSESYAGVGAGAGVVDPDDDEDAETQVEGVLFRPPLGHAHSSTSAHIYRAAAVSVAQEKVGQDAKDGSQNQDTKRGRATERERYPAPGEEYVSVGYGAYAPHGAVLRSQLESVLRAAAASGHGRHGHERHGRGHERRESYESGKSGKSANAKEGRAKRSRERDGQREWCWANSPESSSIPSPTAHSSTSTTPSYPSYAALPALTATAPLPTSNSNTLPHRNSNSNSNRSSNTNSNSNRSSNTNSNRNSTSTTSTIEPLTPPPTPPSHAHAHAHAHQLARSQSHPQSQSHCASPNSNSSSSPFNARSAAKKLRDMDGYVSFANVEGLGNPPGEDDYDEESGVEGAGEGGIMRGLWKVLSAGKGTGAGAGVGRSRSGGRVGA